MKKHGLAIGLERTGTTFYLTLKVVGKLTHDDYSTLTPLVDNALASVPRVKMRVFVDITELEGWELQAAWDDFKFGLKHNKEFCRIAVLGNKKWQQVASKVGNWFTSGEVKYFEDATIAREWLYEQGHK
ncbi:STAS/SEC14 domain-containing protein [Pseudoalteromonas sp. MEBiC 03607]|mgnify:FL=1|uniref:STAS/SEC14 domain-containing protein n=1 Tax=Pseudoalteromonas TaxID=53246 RepID=UPI000C4534DD|nr:MULTISPECIES: STAS/SEC14 domain-containing protein [unclassified Pseudoalteromonas]MBD56478.1 STAS/SEC14 domain-containing protein [Pseudoalteromonas sp.]MCF2899884.1 STAS/SEC14 domain-containing protein [Pseudoalteromonas sp. OFAV1]MCF2919702.1 STAS/SEC14 domain-containing protein [Pseudoalteromonas sp. APAL1]MCO7249896.1 STAS/SEC14 domain-containing protein [Pseudoalteromonas sp. Ps84H-4]TGV21099.1 STAS/SEC14 domain-containing protein [Pseudoalteromonas sp. MEBiC 03607]